MGFKDWLGGAKKAEAKKPDGAKILEDVAQLRRMGRLDDARQQLEQALAGLPDHLDLLRTHWEICVQLDRPAAGVRSLMRAIQGELRAGQGQNAMFHWFEMVERIEQPPALDLDTRGRLAEAMVEGDQADEAARLLESSHEGLDPALPLGVLIRLAKTALASRSPSADALAQAVLQRSGLPDSFREEIQGLYRQAQSEGLRRHSAEVVEEAPIELAAGAPAVRKIRVISAVPLAVDGDQISIDLAGQGRRKMALSQVQGLAAVRIDDGVEPAWVLIDLLLDSLWSDKEVIRTVRLGTRDFDPMTLVPSAGDFQLALTTLLSNLLAITQAHPLPDPEAAVGRPFHGFASIREYEIRVLEATP